MVEIDNETRGYMMGMLSTIVTSLTTLYISTNYILNRASQLPPTPTPSPTLANVSSWNPLTQEQIQQIQNLTQ